MTSQRTQGDSLEARYADVCRRVEQAAIKSGRTPNDVILIAVTKNADPEQIRTLIRMGHKDFGENKVQQLLHRAAMVEELLARQRLHANTRRGGSPGGGPMLFGDERVVDVKPMNAATGSAGVRWHMIGHLQRNKARKIVEYVRLVHSVDSLRLAEELQAIALKRDCVIEILLQVNCSGEATKFGCPLPAAIPLAEQIDTMVNIRLRGLMTMAPESDNPEDARPTFVRCRELFEEMRKLGLTDSPRFNLLSMGMSGDYEVAISEGANLVRVGSAIFGDAPAAEIPDELPEPEDETEGEI
ncbi:MAG: YggS family pyridoxal phosphate-dependent enzyme [Phycisphaerales bacterium]|nr:YggS family pyridoxal phosphate-dependent enzyme [Phycisphaerales bacterium]